MSPKKMSPPHPGQILFKHFLQPMKISQYKLAKDINVPPRRINEIVHGLRSISADTALRFSKYFGNSAEFWLNLQNHYDLECAKDKVEDELRFEVKVFHPKTLA